jgi:hypothetical protein
MSAIEPAALLSWASLVGEPGELSGPRAGRSQGQLAEVTGHRRRLGYPLPFPEVALGRARSPVRAAAHRLVQPGGLMAIP